MLRKLKAIKGNLVLSRVEASQDLDLGGNRFCCGCKFNDDRCVLDLHNNNIQNRDAYDFCSHITPISQRNRKFVYIYAKEKEIL